MSHPSIAEKTTIAGTSSYVETANRPQSAARYTYNVKIRPVGMKVKENIKSEPVDIFRESSRKSMTHSEQLYDPENG
jgi:hypothetical protein